MYRELVGDTETQRLAGGVGDNLRARSRIVAGLRAFFVARDYLEVDTPLLVPSPGLDLHLDAFAVAGAGFLITSPEYQMKRLLAGGLSRIFQLARCFRRGELGQRHQREFTMLEWYRAGGTLADLMDETAALVASVHPGLGPVTRLTVAEAFATHADGADALALAESDEEQFYRTLVDRVEPALATRGAVMLHHFPASQASLARICPDDARVCDRFELYVDGVELCNGFVELTDATEQRRRLERDQAARRERGLPIYPIDERFLAALAEGLPAGAVGNALGVDRLVALCLGEDDIARVQTFPLDWL